MAEGKNRKGRSARAKTASRDPGKRSARIAPKAAVENEPITGRLAAAIARPIADLGKIWERIGKLREPAEFRVSCIRPDDLLVAT